MDMAYAYPAATRKATNATICWDPFHVVMHLNKAVTATIRWSKLTKTGLPLSGDEARDLRWALLKKPGDHTEGQAAVLKRHQRSHHAIWRAQQLKERFRGPLPTRQPERRRRLP
jgi:transposase